MFCKECGKEISDNAKFCEFCGKSVSPISPRENNQTSNQKVTETYAQYHNESNVGVTPFDQSYILKMAYNNISLMYTTVIIEKKNFIGKVLSRKEIALSDIYKVEYTPSHLHKTGVILLYSMSNGLDELFEIKFEPTAKKKAIIILKQLKSHGRASILTLAKSNYTHLSKTLVTSIICVFLALWFIVSNLNSPSPVSPSNKDGAVTELSTKASQTKAQTTAETEKTTVAQITKEEFIKSCQTIDFKTLARNPDKYKGNNYKFTGEVIQVQESSYGLVELRVNVTKNDYGYEDTIYVSLYMGTTNDRILEDDIITVYGTCNGLYTYTSVLGQGISLPSLTALYYTIK